MAVGVRVLELATTAEAQAGTATHVAVTPAGLRADVPATPAASRGVRLDASGDAILPGDVTLPNAGFIGNGAATARAVFDSSGGTDYIELLGAFVGIGTATPQELLHAYAATGTVRAEIETGDGSAAAVKLTNTEGSFSVYTDGDSLRVIDNTDSAVRGRVDGDGNWALWSGAPVARLDIEAGAMRLAEMSAPSAPAANSVLIYAEDNGAGKTRLMALFATGAAQQIAIQP